MTYAWRQIFERGPKSPWCATWCINAPWAHPIWSQYMLHLVDLTTELAKPPIVHLPGATHEFLLFAVAPDTPVDQDVPLKDQKITLLQPANFGYQFRAVDDDAALKRLQSVVEEIIEERLSPDTDFRSTWNALFADAYPMVRDVLPEILGAPDGVSKH